MNLGDYNDLEVAREVDFGLYLTSDDGDLLLPEKYVPVGTRVGDVLRVFVYRDSEDRLIATTLRPLALVNSYAAMTVKDHGPAGAFLEWGLEKDLLLPFRNQRRDLRTGERVLVYVYLDEELLPLGGGHQPVAFLVEIDVHPNPLAHAQVAPLIAERQQQVFL